MWHYAWISQSHRASMCAFVVRVDVTRWLHVHASIISTSQSVIASSSSTCSTSGMPCFMPRPTIVCREHYVLGLSVCLSVNTYFAWQDFSSLSGEISMKLSTDVHSVSGHCWKGFQGQKRSKVKVTAGPTSLCQQRNSHQLMAAHLLCIGWRHSDQRCGMNAGLFPYKTVLLCIHCTVIAVILQQQFFSGSHFSIDCSNVPSACRVLKTWHKHRCNLFHGLNTCSDCCCSRFWW